MNENKIDEYKKKLLEEKNNIEEEIKKLSIHVDMGDEPGFQDESSESEDTYNRQGEIILLKRRRSDIDSALLRMQKEEYGKCLLCGADIDESLLDEDSARSYCEACVEKIRRQDKSNE